MFVQVGYHCGQHWHHSREGAEKCLVQHDKVRFALDGVQKQRVDIGERHRLKGTVLPDTDIIQ